MSDTTAKKVDASHSPQGQMGQTYLASGKKLALRRWTEEPGKGNSEHERSYETAGYVIEGRAKLHLEEQTLMLEPGDSWIVPEGARHSYEVLDTFTAVEATSPPARMHKRDEE